MASRTLPSSRDHHGVPRRLRGHGAAYDRVRETLLGQPCHWCGRPADSADYLIPWSEGGTLADLVPACASCNYARGARLAAEKRRHRPTSPPLSRRRRFRVAR